MFLSVALNWILRPSHFSPGDPTNFRGWGYPECTRAKGCHPVVLFPGSSQLLPEVPPWPVHSPCRRSPNGCGVFRRTSHSKMSRSSLPLIVSLLTLIPRRILSLFVTLYLMYPDGKERPISLGDAERNYSQLEKEGLAIILGVKKFTYFFVVDNLQSLQIISPCRIYSRKHLQYHKWPLQGYSIGHCY